MRHLVVCAAALTLVCCHAGRGAVTQTAVTHTVTIDASRFDPDDLTVKAGDTVVWVNKDIIAHTATSSTGGFDSGDIAPGRSWTQHYLRTGEFPYVCTYHAMMKGTLRVQ